VNHFKVKSRNLLFYQAFQAR